MPDLRDPPKPDISLTRVSNQDSIESLHKMSTTAGVATQEYVAINITAVLALLLGLLSILTLADPIFSVVPLAGVIFGLVGLSQIKNSGGTQTGRGFAIIGLVFSLGFGGFSLARGSLEAYVNRKDRAIVGPMVQQFGELVSQRKYDQAYAMCGEAFRSRVSGDDFAGLWEAMRTSRTLGAVREMKWNGTVIFEPIPDSKDRTAATMALIDYEKSPDVGRQPIAFRKTGSAWHIDDIPRLFTSDVSAGRRR